MNSKMTTNSQLSTNELKKSKEKQRKQKLSKQLEQEQKHRNGDHMEGYQWGWGRGKGTGNKKQNRQVQNRQGEIKNSIGNGEAKELICTTHGHELRWEGSSGQRGIKGGTGTTVIA